MAAIFLMGWIEFLSSAIHPESSPPQLHHVEPSNPYGIAEVFKFCIVTRSTRDAVLTRFDVVGFIKGMVVRDMDLCIESEEQGGKHP